MGWQWALAEAWLVLRFYWRRTSIAAMSLAWGVCCFVVLMAYGDGFERALIKAFTAVGQHLVVIYGGQTSQQAGGLRAGRRIRLEFEDAQLIKETVPLVGAVSPERLVGGVKIARGTYEGETTIRAVWPEYQRIRNLHIAEGRWISPTDDAQQLRVVVLGAEVAEKVFRGAPALGQVVRLNKVSFTVIGVLQKKLQIANYNRRDNDCVFIPYQTARAFTDVGYPTFIVWQPAYPGALEPAIRAVRAKLAEAHKFSPMDTRAVEILPFDQFMQLVTGMVLALRLLLLLVGGLTLTIGGVALAHMMLATVLHRTREIGTLKALGARAGDIMRQLILEALAIVGIGGAVGLMLAASAVYAIGSLPFLGPVFEDQSGLGDIYLHLSPKAVLTSVALLGFVGLVAAIVPAFRAARLDPIESLRYE